MLWELWVLLDLRIALSRLWERGGGGLMGFVQSWEFGARTRPSPFEVYPAGKLQCYFTYGFNFRHSLWLPFTAAFAVLKGLNNVFIFALENGVQQHNSVNKTIFLNVESFPIVSNKSLHKCIGSISATFWYFIV